MKTSASAQPSRLRPSVLGTPALAALAGATLLVVVAARFRLDLTLCSAWPSRAIGCAYGVVYLVAVLLLAWAWKRGVHPLFVVAAHAIALGAAPFLSSDPLMYAAVGRALSLGAPATRDVTSALGADHPFLVPLVPAWRLGTSAYGPAWNAIASVVGHAMKDHLGATLRAHQLVACLSILVGAALVARTRAAFVTVALCPLAVVEATIGAHNDALLVPFAALALVCWQRRRPLVAAVVLCAGVLVKASAAIYAAPVVLALFLAWLPSARARRLALACVVPLSGLALVLMAQLANGPLDALARIVGRPDVPYDHCTRSFECLPRILFRFVFHAGTLAWATGIVFRLVGALWLAYASLRAAEAPRKEALAWIVRGLFIYFLALHGWAQSWYALPLVVALPGLEGDTQTLPALRAYLVSSVCYYALVLPMSCLDNPVLVAVSDLAEGLVTVVPPIVLLARARKSS
ncbi:MAG: hypothetical protein ABI321_23035 [Polyangia bacterium]